MISAKIDNSVTFFYDTSIFYLWYKIFFLLLLFSSSNRTDCVTLLIPSCADTRREPLRRPREKASLFLSSKKHFWQTFLFFQNCTSYHSTCIRIFSSVWVAFSHPVSVWIFMVLIPALPLAELQPCIQLHSIS